MSASNDKQTIRVCNDCDISADSGLMIHHLADDYRDARFGKFEQYKLDDVDLCDDCLYHAIDRDRGPDDVSIWFVEVKPMADSLETFRNSANTSHG